MRPRLCRSFAGKRPPNASSPLGPDPPACLTLFPFGAERRKSRARLPPSSPTSFVLFFFFFEGNPPSFFRRELSEAAPAPSQTSQTSRPAPPFSLQPARLPRASPAQRLRDPAATLPAWEGVGGRWEGEGRPRGCPQPGRLPEEGALRVARNWRTELLIRSLTEP